MSVLKMFDVCNVDISWLSRRYLMGVLYICDGFPHISDGILNISDGFR